MAITGSSRTQTFTNIFLDGSSRSPFGYFGDSAETLSFDFDGEFEDQTISGNAERSEVLVSGDSSFLEGNAYGGDDTITVSATYVLGDAIDTYDNAEQFGGKDVIALLENLFDDEYYVIGDAQYIARSVFHGGADTIRAYRDEDARGTFYGDAEYVGYNGVGAKAFGGNDSIRGSNGADLIFGDFYRLESQAELARGGDDVLRGYGGDDTLVGDAWETSDKLAEAGDDRIYGGGGDDTIYGDMMSGGVTDAKGASLSGRDRIFGGVGDDAIWAGIGADRAEGGRGRDFIDGGDGDDTIRGDAGKDELHGGSGGDDIHGGAGSDSIFGDTKNAADPAVGGNDLIEGGKGRDTLHGGDGDDALFGGRHADRIDGGAGADVLTGGRDADVFVLTSVDDDRITDFSRDEGDRIDLSGVAAIRGWRDLNRNHLVDDADDGSSSILVDDWSLLLEGLDRSDLDRADFIF